MGLTRNEIRAVFDLVQALIKKVDRGAVTVVPASQA
jgi:hypothetical protein